MDSAKERVRHGNALRQRCYTTRHGKTRKPSRPRFRHPNSKESPAWLNDCLAELIDAQFDNLVANESADWDVASLLDIASYKNGLAMQRFRPVGDDPGLPVLKIRELGQGYCGSDAERCRSDIDESVTIHDGDLVFSWSGTLLLDFWAGGDAGLNQHLFKVASGVYPSWFYYMWTKQHMRRFIALAKDRATTMGHIKRSALQESEVLIPPADLMVELSAKNATYRGRDDWPEGSIA